MTNKINFLNDYLTPAEVAGLKGVSRPGVYLWMKSGVLPFVRDRHGRLFIKRKVAIAFKPPLIGRPRKEKP